MAALVKSSIGGEKFNPFIAGLDHPRLRRALRCPGHCHHGRGTAYGARQVPVVLGTTAFNAFVVQALFFSRCARCSVNSLI